MYITQLFAEAFVSLAIGVGTGYCAIYMGCEPNVAPFVGLSVAMASYACRASTEALMMSEDIYNLLNGVTITINRNKPDNIEE